jgi:acetyl-CoA synthetase
MGIRRGKSFPNCATNWLLIKRIRRLEFIDLPKTASGKIRRAELRRAEQNRLLETARRQLEFLDQDF